MNADHSDTPWFKSSYSSGGMDCVEIAFLDDDIVGVRDSKNPTGPALSLTPGEWSSFTTAIITGRFDGA